MLRASEAPPPPEQGGFCAANGHGQCHALWATGPTAVVEKTKNKKREEELETRLIEAAQDYLACKGIPVALVQLPGSRPSTFVVIGMSEDLPDMLHSAYRRLRPES